MKQHLGFTKTKVSSNMHAVCANEIAEYDLQDNSLPSSMEQIQKQIASLQAQITAFTVSTKETSVKPKKFQPPRVRPNETQSIPQTQSPVQQTPSRPRPWYCFKCGEDGHIIVYCSNSPNPTLVDTKRKQLKEKQQAWDKKNTSNDTDNLN